MSTKKMLKEYLDTHKVFDSGVHSIITTAINTVTGEVPYRLKLSIALSELITITSHMRKNIKLYDGTIVPCNAITMGLAGSGVSKDASLQAIRKALKPSYEVIETYRKDLARHNAEKAAILDGKTKEDWSAYYDKPRDLAAGLGTVEGLLNHFSILSKGEVGAAAINSSEIGSELLTNGNMTEIVKAISVGYDLGIVPAKIVKSNENQTDSINGLPINALFFGSQDAILYDNSVKSKFKMMFNTQLARRSIFSFSAEKMLPMNFKSIDDLTIYRRREREKAVKAQESLTVDILEMVNNTDQVPLTITPEAQTLFDVYKEYNNIVSEEMSSRYPISKLSRRHKQWLALKLAGNYAILDGNEEVTLNNYVMAISTIESLTDDLTNFENELVKEAYEVFVEFCQYNAEEGKYNVSLHTLRKLGYISGTGTPKNKLDDLCHLASSYDVEGIYTVCDNSSICYEKIQRTDVVGISYVEVSGTKEQRAKQCSEGFEFYPTDFEELSGLLQDDFAYSPFQFKDGIRSKDSIIGGTKVLVLDIDKSNITDEECSLMLSDINHHIARTSDKNNQFKFRVLIELDAVVDITDLQWRYFIEEASKELGLEIDRLPKSQIFYSYAGREVLSNLDTEPLATKQLLINSAEKLTNKPKPTKLTSKQQQALLSDPLTTFSFAFDAENGSKSRNMIRAALYARDLNATEDYIVNLMYEIGDYLVPAMEHDRIEQTLISQIRRWF